MGHVINTNTPGKRRNHHLRTIAEIMRRIGQRGGEVDAEVQDMAAMVLYCLREIDASIYDSIKAWEKRGYWSKADKFQDEWRWAHETAERLEDVLRYEDWPRLPEVFIGLLPRISTIEVKNMTRNPADWEGCYAQLLAEQD